MLQNLFVLRRAVQTTFLGVRKTAFVLQCVSAVEPVSYVQNISSSAIIFRFMKRREDVENTVNRLRNRGELSSRHVLAAVKILNSMNQSPSPQFFHQLLNSTLEFKHQFQLKDLCRIFHLLVRNGANQTVQLEELGTLLLESGSLDSLSGNELKVLIGDLSRMKERSGSRIPVLEDALFEEVVKGRRLKAFQDWQLACIIEALTKFKDQADDKVERYMNALIEEVSTFDRLKRFSVSELMSIIKLVEHCHCEDEATLMAFYSRILHFKTQTRIPAESLDLINRALYRLEKQRTSLCNASIT